ncbi:MAG: porin [Candidatus Competibacteraceae bacterium]
MKKSTLALAVAAALATSVAVADTTLYGSARVSIDYESLDNGPDTWDVRNNSSRLGVRGEEDLGGGLSAIYQYEFGVDMTEGGNFESNRPKWLGLKGDSWGSVTLGTQWTSYYNVAGVADIFNSNRSFATNTGYLGGQWGQRSDNTIIYMSPNFSGFSAEATLVMNGTSSAGRVPDTSDGVDLWQIAGKYKNGPFYAGGAWMQLNNSDIDELSGDDLRQWMLVGAYQPGPFTVGLLYEQGDLNTVSTSPLTAGLVPLDFDDTMNIMLFGSYNFGPHSIRAAYSWMEPDGSYFDVARDRNRSYSEIQNLLLGYQFNLSKRTRLWAEYLGRWDDNEGVLSNVPSDQNVLSLGMRHDF